MARRRKVANSLATAVNEIMDTYDLTAHLHCSKVTVYRFVKNHEFPAFRLGYNLRFRRTSRNG